jgi:hypothetical protein
MIRATTSAFAGRLDDARSYINAADDVTDDSDPLWSEIAIAKGDLLLAIQPPDVATAERLFERAAQRSAEAGARMAQLQAATRLARLRRGTPREAEARESLQQLLDSFTEGFTTPHVVTATRALES